MVTINILPIFVAHTIDFHFSLEQAVKKLGKFKLESKVSVSTTHLVSLDNRRTVNILRGIIRGCWILNYDWILKSVNANKWLPESKYEMRHFSRAVEVNILHSIYLKTLIKFHKFSDKPY